MTHEEVALRFAANWARNAEARRKLGAAERAAREFLATIPGESREKASIVVREDRVEVYVPSPFPWEGAWVKTFKA